MRLVNRKKSKKKELNKKAVWKSGKQNNKRMKRKKRKNKSEQKQKNRNIRTEKIRNI